MRYWLGIIAGSSLLMAQPSENPRLAPLYANPSSSQDSALSADSAVSQNLAVPADTLPEREESSPGNASIQDGDSTLNSVAPSAPPVSAGSADSASSVSSSQAAVAAGGEGDAQVPAQQEEMGRRGAVSPGFSGSIVVGFVTVDGEQMTRLSLRPEFSIGPLGVALDLEMFIASDGRILSRGWEFDTREHTVQSLYRKLYYIRWNQPGDMFYVRLGALEGITMDAAGLITRNWGNVALYPGQKLIGTHVQFNDWLDPWGVSVELATNSLEDWNHGGGVLGGKMSFRPLGAFPLPVVRSLRLGAMAMRDFNQFATIPDRDGDSCPDRVDEISGSGCKYLRSFMDPDSLEWYYRDGRAQLLSWLDRVSETRDAAERQIAERFGSSDAFTLIALDYQLPLLDFDLLKLGLYGEFARPWLSEGSSLNQSWALVPAGVGAHVWKLNLNLEYRRIRAPFQVGHFNAAYEMERVRFLRGEYLTKEQTYWEASSARGIVQGIYGWGGMDVFGLADIEASYYHMLGKNDYKDRGYTAKAALGKTILQYIPRINLLEAYYNKDHLYEDGDDFFDRSIYTVHGYRVGFALGDQMTVIIGNMTTYTRDPSGKLEPQSNFTAETVISF